MTAIIILNSRPETIRILSCQSIRFHVLDQEFFKNTPVHVFTDNHWDDHSFPITDIVKIEIVNSI